MSDRLFADIAHRTPCTCYSSAIYYRDGCECSALEKVCKAHLLGVAVEPLTVKQQDYIIQDTCRSDPGPWDGAEVQGPGRDEAICSDWKEALSRYVGSM